MRIICLLLAATFGTAVIGQAQDSVITKKADRWANFDFNNRANDHFMIQVGYDGWAGKPAEAITTGIGRHFNFYLMYDMPFKTDPRWSAAIGAGVGTSNIYFKDTYVDLAGKVSTTGASFVSTEGEESFKKYKMTTAYLEAPIELRYVANPYNTNKSFKFAFGVKVGAGVSATTKGKDLLNEAGQSLYGTKYIVKEKDRKFLNSTRFAGTLRVGYGSVSLHGAYSIVTLFKTGAGPEIRPYSVGLTFSGL